MATTKRNLKKPTTTRAGASKRPARVAAINPSEFDDADGFGPDDPWAESEKQATGKGKQTAKAARRSIATASNAPLPFGMVRCEAFGHSYRTIGAVNVFAIGMVDTIRHDMVRRVYESVFPGDKYSDDDEACLARWGRWVAENTAEAAAWTQIAFYDALFRPEGDAPLISSLIATAEHDDPEMEVIGRHVVFFNANAAAR